MKEPWSPHGFSDVLQISPWSPGLFKMMFASILLLASLACACVITYLDVPTSEFGKLLDEYKSISNPYEMKTYLKENVEKISNEMFILTKWSMSYSRFDISRELFFFGKDAPDNALIKATVLPFLRDRIGADPTGIVLSMCGVFNVAHLWNLANFFGCGYFSMLLVVSQKNEIVKLLTFEEIIKMRSTLDEFDYREIAPLLERMKNELIEWNGNVDSFTLACALVKVLSGFEKGEEHLAKIKAFADNSLKIEYALMTVFPGKAFGRTFPETFLQLGGCDFLKYHQIVFRRAKSEFMKKWREESCSRTDKVHYIIRRLQEESTVLSKSDYVVELAFTGVCIQLKDEELWGSDFELVKFVNSLDDAKATLIDVWSSLEDRDLQRTFIFYFHSFNDGHELNLSAEQYYIDAVKQGAVLIQNCMANGILQTDRLKAAFKVLSPIINMKVLEIASNPEEFAFAYLEHFDYMNWSSVKVSEILTPDLFFLAAAKFVKYHGQKEDLVYIYIKFLEDWRISAEQEENAIRILISLKGMTRDVLFHIKKYLNKKKDQAFIVLQRIYDDDPGTFFYLEEVLKKYRK